MTSSPDTLLVTGETLQQVSAGSVLITPTGGSQTTLADALTTSTGGAVAATTLTASSTVTLSPASHNVTLSPTGTGVVTIAPATAGTMNRMVIGGTVPAAGTFTTVTGTSLAVTGNVAATATTLGFYGASAVAQQTGVAVTAAGIHAALVSLGLITA